MFLFLQDHIQGINTLNIAGKGIVLNSQDTQSSIDFKTDNYF